MAWHGMAWQHKHTHTQTNTFIHSLTHTYINTDIHKHTHTRTHKCNSNGFKIITLTFRCSRLESESSVLRGAGQAPKSGVSTRVHVCLLSISLASRDSNVCSRLRVVCTPRRQPGSESRTVQNVRACVSLFALHRPHKAETTRSAPALDSGMTTL